MPFLPGISGNDKGRPQNSGHRQKIFNALVNPHREVLVNKAIEMALNGNEAMLKLFLERLLPPKVAHESVEIQLPAADMTKANSMLILGQNILFAISNNSITPEQGKTLLDLVTSQRKNIEAISMSDRIAEIEYTLNLRKQEKSNE